MSERFVPSRLVLIAAAALLVFAPLSARADNDHHGGGRSHGKHYKHYGKHGGKHYGPGYAYYAPPAVYYGGPPPCARPRRVNVYNYYPAVVPVPVPIAVAVPHRSNVVVRVGVDWLVGF